MIQLLNFVTVYTLQHVWMCVSVGQVGLDVCMQVIVF